MMLTFEQDTNGRATAKGKREIERDCDIAKEIALTLANLTTKQRMRVLTYLHDRYVANPDTPDVPLK